MRTLITLMLMLVSVGFGADRGRYDYTDLSFADAIARSNVEYVSPSDSSATIQAKIDSMGDGTATSPKVLHFCPGYYASLNLSFDNDYIILDASEPGVVLAGTIAGDSTATGQYVYLWDHPAKTCPATLELQYFREISKDSQPTEAFNRNSIAYLSGVEVAADTARTTTGLVVSTSDGTLVTAGGVGGANVIPQCVTGGYLYAIEGNVTYGRICKSADGITWARTASSQPLSSVTVTPAGNLLASNNDSQTLWRSTDGGESWTNVTPTGDNATSAAVNFSMRWSYRAHGTTMLLAEYGPSSHLGGRYIFRSTDDGVTWVRCFDATDITETESAQIYHWHGVGYNALAGRWVAFAGDMAARRSNVYSDDDGLTWNVLNEPGSYFEQPLGGMIDLGGYYLLTGGDGSGSILQVDVRDGSYATKYNGFARDVGNYYIFDVFEYDDLYYACKATNTAGIYDMSILVSADAEHWVPYHCFDESDKISQVYYAGFLNGKLHFYAMDTVNNVYKHFKMSPARVSEVQGTLISGTATNLLSANNSSAETSATLWVNNAVGWTSIAQSSDSAVHGTKSVKVVIPTGGATGSATLNSDTSLTAGKTYIISAWMKTNYPCLWSLRAYYRSGDGVTQKYASDDAQYAIGTAWQYIRSKPFTVAAGEENYYRIYFTYSGASTGYTTNPTITTYIDAVSITEVPLDEWQVGGPAKAADVQTETIDSGDAWTDIFAFELPYPQAAYASAAALTIKTWSKDADNKIVLFYDPSDKKFKLQRTVASSTKTAVGSTAQYWHGNACVKMILRVSADDVKLSIQNGKAVETLDDDGIALTDSKITGTYGTMPMVVMNGWVYDIFVPQWISDADVIDVMGLKVPDYTLETSDGVFGN